MLLAAVLLIDPKYPHNVGGAMRACAAFGVGHLRWTGERVTTDGRLPREERYRNYKNDVDFAREPDALRRLVGEGLIPVAVEVRNNSEALTLFEHPDLPLYVFGPEDGSLPKAVLASCHRFLHIPTHYALNLAAAVNIVLYDRRAKRQLSGLEPVAPLVDYLARA